VLASSSASGVGLVQNDPPRAWGQDGPSLAPFSWLGNHGYWYEGQLARTLHYVRARWYAEADPHGWISADPLGFEGGDGNLYRYVGNRPTVSVDPKGLYSITTNADNIAGAYWICLGGSTPYVASGQGLKSGGGFANRLDPCEAVDQAFHCYQKAHGCDKKL